MATKRRTEHDPTRQPRRTDDPDVQAAPAERSAGGAPDEAGPDEAAAEPVQAEPVQAEPAQAEPMTDAKKPADEAPDRRIEELASQLEEVNGRRLRLAADFENYKKRIRQEQVDTMRYAAATVAERLLPVVDDAERALNHVPDGIDESWLKGVRLTFQKLQEVLASVGVERIEALGAQFDPKLHEAVGSEETAKHPEDTVVGELRPGYRMHDRVLRPALVKVARPPA
jgi:molecular chaperone GrpE